MAIFGGDRRTHDACAHGETTILRCERTPKILALHVELYRAHFCATMLVEFVNYLVLVRDLAFTLPLRARL
jgi:hypothetical protein